MKDSSPEVLSVFIVTLRTVRTGTPCSFHVWKSDCRGQNCTRTSHRLDTQLCRDFGRHVPLQKRCSKFQEKKKQSFLFASKISGRTQNLKPASHPDGPGIEGRALPVCSVTLHSVDSPGSSHLCGTRGQLSMWLKVTALGQGWGVCVWGEALPCQHPPTHTPESTP